MFLICQWVFENFFIFFNESIFKLSNNRPVSGTDHLPRQNIKNVFDFVNRYLFLEKFLHASTLDLAADSNYGIAVGGPELAVGVNEAIIPKLMVKLDVRAFRMRKINKRVNEFFLIHSQNPFSKVVAVLF